MEYDAKIASRYDSARQLPDATMRLWLEAIAEWVPASEIKTILDLGCGTGRFCGGLADRFKAQVIGLDPSEDMLAKARNNNSNPRVQFHAGAAESIPFQDQSICLIYMSMVYHHIKDIVQAGAEFYRVLRRGGYVCIRNSTKELLHQVLYLKFFRGASEFNYHRLPSQQDVTAAIGASGFSLLTHQVIRPQSAESLREYYDKVSQRALSDLVRLSDAEFEAGLQRMREAIEGNEISGPIIEPIDLFIFRKGVA